METSENRPILKQLPRACEGLSQEEGVRLLKQVQEGADERPVKCYAPIVDPVLLQPLLDTTVRVHPFGNTGTVKEVLEACFKQTAMLLALKRWETVSNEADVRLFLDIWLQTALHLLTAVEEHISPGEISFQVEAQAEGLGGVLDYAILWKDVVVPIIAKGEVGLSKYIGQLLGQMAALRDYRKAAATSSKKRKREFKLIVGVLTSASWWWFFGFLPGDEQPVAYHCMFMDLTNANDLVKVQAAVQPLLETFLGVLRAAVSED